MLAITVIALAVAVAAHPPLQRAVANVVTSCVQPNMAALTFDDGPYMYMDQIVDTLDANNAKGTFFINGMNFDCIYNDDEAARVQRTFSKGHQIASHTWSHAHLSTLSQGQVTSEFTKTQTAIKKITGATPSFTRPPYGEYNDIVQQVASEQEQTLVIWDFDSGDSDGATVDAMKSAYDTLAASHPSNILALNHETRRTLFTRVSRFPPRLTLCSSFPFLEETV
ncbi:hypothetical protein E1B28_005727 [Marasmius oreades]|uniref:NodB homology domain-containing protein n=1 Tax=Marasmius oreades TaxID=181124 RepID=A0A9P7UVV7_9AGAR|nr:uncharacterized protein E1B28_005727 [Marasmius oreades]KAG7094921.1 hypothetical protein E1B28_005727 [Marasmius oreades]